LGKATFSWKQGILYKTFSSFNYELTSFLKDKLRASGIWKKHYQQKTVSN